MVIKLRSLGYSFYLCLPTFLLLRPGVHIAAAQKIAFWFWVTEKKYGLRMVASQWRSQLCMTRWRTRPGARHQIPTRMRQALCRGLVRLLTTAELVEEQRCWRCYQNCSDIELCIVLLNFLISLFSSAYDDLNILFSIHKSTGWPSQFYIWILGYILISGCIGWHGVA